VRWSAYAIGQQSRGAGQVGFGDAIEPGGHRLADLPQAIGDEGLGGFSRDRRAFEVAFGPGVRLLQSKVRDEARLDRDVIDRVLRGGPEPERVVADPQVRPPAPWPREPGRLRSPS
jgi:hypothetical protein